MENTRENLTQEQKEKEAIALENKLLAILMPSVGLIAFVIGLVGFILIVGENVGGAVFLMILAVLGMGGIAYGVYRFLKWQKNRYRKKDIEPSQEPNRAQ